MTDPAPHWQVQPTRHVEATVGVCPDERCGMFDRPQGTEDGRCETCNTTLGPAGSASREQAYASRIAMCMAEDGPHEHIPLRDDEPAPETCFADCDCTPAVYRLSPPGITVSLTREELDALVDDLKVKAILRESWSPDQPEPLVRAVGRLMEAQDG